MSGRYLVKLLSCTFLSTSHPHMCPVTQNCASVHASIYSAKLYTDHQLLGIAESSEPAKFMHVEGWLEDSPKD